MCPYYSCLYTFGTDITTSLLNQQLFYSYLCNYNTGNVDELIKLNLVLMLEKFRVIAKCHHYHHAMSMVAIATATGTASFW